MIEILSLPAKQQLIWWGFGALLFLTILWVLGDTLLPFIVGSALAYFLDPVADRLEKAGCNRFISTSIITVGALSLLIIALVFLIPVLINQLSELIEFLPKLFDTLLIELQARLPVLQGSQSLLEQYHKEIQEVITTHSASIISTLFVSARSTISGVVFMVIVPVVMVYMLADWDRMIRAINQLLPLDHADQIRELARETDRVLAGFVRGQVSVCALLATYYSVLLLIVGLDFGLVVGIVAGIISFIPFVGAIIGALLAIGLAVFQFWSEPWFIALVVFIFISGQILEGNFLTPKIVGKSIGLHPVWLLFALTAFGAVFGFVGLLVAVPAAAVVGVFFRFGIKQYMKGVLYRGSSQIRDS